MNRLHISLSLFFMFFTAAIYAQKRQELELQWTVAAELPVTGNGQTALGFAGMVAGVYSNKLIIAGGANFPDAMPWNGGKKKYYDDVYVYVKKGNRFVLQQQTKLSFSIALLHEPQIVFLDEPTGGVDPITRRQFWEMIYAEANKGTTIFVTTHYMDEAEYCDRVSIMVEGVIEALDSPKKLKEKFNVTSMNDVFLKLARNVE